MRTLIKTVFWTTLWLSAIFSTLGLFIADQNWWALLVGIGWAIVVVASLTVSDWFFGIRRRVTSHLGVATDSATFVTRELGSSRLVDVLLAMERLRDQNPMPRLGITDHLRLDDLRQGNAPAQRLVWRTERAGPDDLVNVPENAVYLADIDGLKFSLRVAFAKQPQFHGDEKTFVTGRGNQLQLVAATLDDANAAVRWIEQQSPRQSIYRGQFLHVATPEGGAGQSIRMVPRHRVTADRIVLNDAILMQIDDLIGGVSRHAAALRDRGHTARLGLLLHGPPGTGKTLVTRLIIANHPEHTVITPTDPAVETLRESFRLATYLSPAILVIEDVDLLARRRDESTATDGLQELMNQMDGLVSVAETIVVLSTNRPETVEPALASRPGRDSQAIRFDLPRADQRRQLLRLFLSKVDCDAGLIPKWADRATDASPAWIQEWCRRIQIRVLDRSDGAAVDGDFAETIDSLIFPGHSFMDRSET